MRRNKSLIGIVAALVTCLAFGGGSAYAHRSRSDFVQGGVFQANLLVTAVTPTPSTGACSFAVGDTLAGIVQLGPGGGDGSTANEGATYRLSVNTPSAFTILEEVFPDLTGGSYMFGTPGTTLATGTFSATYTALDNDSVLAVNKLTFTSPVDGTTSCAETDQVTLIRISNSQQGNQNSQGNQNQNQQ